MSRVWKPGDVAIRVGRGGKESLAVCVAECRNHSADLHWHTFHEGRSDWDTLIFSGVTYRPLVVIDPEDAEQVEKLLLARWRASGFDTAESGPSSRVIDEWQAALREFADPKPPPCGASLTIGKAGALYHCAEPAGHESPHTSGSFIWTAVLP